MHKIQENAKSQSLLLAQYFFGKSENLKSKNYVPKKIKKTFQGFFFVNSNLISLSSNLKSVFSTWKENEKKEEKNVKCVIAGIWKYRKIRKMLWKRVVCTTSQNVK